MTFIFPVSTIWWMVCILQYHSLGSFLILEYVWTMCISVKYYLLFFQVPNLSILLSLGSEFSIYWDEACLLWTGQMLSLASTSGFHANITNHQSSRICLKTSLIVLVVAISTGELQRLRTSIGRITPELCKTRSRVPTPNASDVGSAKPGIVQCRMNKSLRTYMTG